MDEYQPMNAPGEPAAAVAQSAPGQRPASEGGQAPANGMPMLKDARQARDFFSDPEAMYHIAQLAAQYRQPDTMKWLAMGARAVQENAIEATQHLIAGDGEAAVKAFNKSGRFNDAESAARNDDGTWTLKRKGGASITINPEVVMKSFLSPKDFAEQMQSEARTKVQQQTADTQAKVADNQARYQDGMLKHYERSDDSQAKSRVAQIELAQERLATQAEMQRQRDATAAATREGKAEADRERALLNERYGPLALYNKIMEGDTPDAQQKAERALASHPQVVAVRQPNGTVGLFHRNQIASGKPTEDGGAPYLTMSVPDYEQLTGRKLPKTASGPPPEPGAAPPAKRTSTPAPSATGESWAQAQNEATLSAVVERGGPYAQFAQAELERRKTAPAPAPRSLDDAPRPVIRGPNVPRSLPAW